MSKFQRNYVKNDKNLEIFTIDNFLKEEECEYLCTIIQRTSDRSTVAANDGNGSQIHPGRTSYTSTLSETDPIVQIIEQRMFDELGIPKEKGEAFQGQIYEVGQEFKHHYDWFPHNTYERHCAHSGQRTWTFMIYLNNVEEGGETDFPEIGKKFIPKKASAVVWKNSDGKGTENSAALHAGLPVIKGKKMVITKWYRENTWDMAKDIELSIEKSKDKQTSSNKIIYTPDITENNSELTKKIFKTKEDLPKLTKLGFKVVKIPEKTWRLIQEVYQLIQNSGIEEQNVKDYVHDKDGNNVSDIFQLDPYPRIKQIIMQELQPLHEEFIAYKERLSPLWIYGIRSYKRGAILDVHTDTIKTHHISSIIIVDKKVENDWALDIQSHDGKIYSIYTEPGDMILYESATCPHGRPEAFEGDYYRNFFMHYTLADYKYEP